MLALLFSIMSDTAGAVDAAMARLAAVPVFLLLLVHDLVVVVVAGAGAVVDWVHLIYQRQQQQRLSVSHLPTRPTFHCNCNQDDMQEHVGGIQSDNKLLEVGGNCRWLQYAADKHKSSRMPLRDRGSMYEFTDWSCEQQ